MVLAAHFTPLGDRLTVTTAETVRFEPPERVPFRLVRGPVPHLTETFELGERDDGIELALVGELGTDLWRLGTWWGEQVSRLWSAPSPTPSRTSEPKPNVARAST